MKKRFGELPIGARFCYRAHRYEKMTPQIGRHEENGGSVFHASTEVIQMQNVECGTRNQAGARPGVAPLKPPAVPKEPRDRLPSGEQRGAALEMLRRLNAPYRPLPDGWHGTYVDEHSSKERKN